MSTVLLVENIFKNTKKMLKNSPSNSPQPSFFDIVDQLDASHPLMQLSQALNWSYLEDGLSKHYSPLGRGSKPIRLMVGILMLKQLYNLSDEVVVEQWRMNPYYQVFCGEVSFQTKPPCHSTELVKFRQRIGKNGFNLIFKSSILLHGDAALEPTILVDTTVQEKNITYPTDHKLAIKIINHLIKLAKLNGVKLRRTYVKEVKELRLACRHFRHVKRRVKAKKALKRLRTIAGTLLRDLDRKLPEHIKQAEQGRFDIYWRVLKQKRNDKDKIYSLHEVGVYCIGKGKDHKPYEFGRKASIALTANSLIAVGVKSHKKNVHDSKTLKGVVDEVEHNRGAKAEASVADKVEQNRGAKAKTSVANKVKQNLGAKAKTSVANKVKQNLGAKVETIVVDKGYRGSKKSVDSEVIIPSPPLKSDSEEERQRKRKLCKRISAIEPVIGHLKQDFRLLKNYLKGATGDSINLTMAATAWNLRKWMVIFFVFIKFIKIANFFDFVLNLNKSHGRNIDEFLLRA